MPMHEAPGPASEDQHSTSRLVALLYDALHASARAHLRQERPDHTLQPTALVNEAYLRLAGEERGDWASEAEFFAAAAEAMRRILIEHARSRNRLKRGGDRRRVAVPESSIADLAAEGEIEKILALDDAIRRVTVQDERLARIIQLRVFAGLTIEKTAEVLGVSERTVKRDWSFARAWLARQINDED